MAFLLLPAALLLPESGAAQVSYVARFEVEKTTYLAGEPVFCRFSIRNTGTQAFAFRYRFPTRALNPELESEPRFAVTAADGRKLRDPAPRPCGGAKGSAVYGSVTLPPGQAHTERWLLNQWARLTSPGRYRVRAERRLPLLGWDAAKLEFSQKPLAYALAMNQLSFELAPVTESTLRAAFEPYVKTLNHPTDAAEAVLVVTTLPQSFLLDTLRAMTSAPEKERRWDRQQVLEGLARLGSREAWEVIADIARGKPVAGARGHTGGAAPDNALRAHAVLLLGQKGDPTFLPVFLDLVSTGAEELRGDALRALGLFNHPRANQVLFERLRSPSPHDRVNAILGLRNLRSKEAIPALIAMLNDPEAQVRQVAHFALQGLTGQKLKLSADASSREVRRVAGQWQAWWGEHGARFVPARPAACRDW